MSFNPTLTHECGETFGNVVLSRYH